MLHEGRGDPEAGSGLLVLISMTSIVCRLQDLAGTLTLHVAPRQAAQSR